MEITGIKYALESLEMLNCEEVKDNALSDFQGLKSLIIPHLRKYDYKSFKGKNQLNYLDLSQSKL